MSQINWEKVEVEVKQHLYMLPLYTFVVTHYLKIMISKTKKQKDSHADKYTHKHIYTYKYTFTHVGSDTYVLVCTCPIQVSSI